VAVHPDGTVDIQYANGQVIEHVDTSSLTREDPEQPEPAAPDRPSADSRPSSAGSRQSTAGSRPTTADSRPGTTSTRPGTGVSAGKPSGVDARKPRTLEEIRDENSPRQPGTPSLLATSKSMSLTPIAALQDSPHTNVGPRVGSRNGRRNFENARAHQSEMSSLLSWE